MTNEQQKALDLLRQYREIKTREAEVERWRKHINDDLARLYDQQSRAEAEAKLIEEKLKTEFAEFESSNIFDFKIEPTDERRTEIKQSLKKRINKETKDQIFKTIVDSYIFGKGKNDFPVMTFEKIRDELQNQFSIETDNMTQFFRDQLRHCQTFGGTRNKAVWIPVEMLDISREDYEELAASVKDRIQDDESIEPKPWEQ